MSFNWPPKLLTPWQQFCQDPAVHLVRWLYRACITVKIPSLSTAPITLVCVSDTHTTQPLVPDGDVLLHAGDLSKFGTFEEIQAQLDWLNRQPHKYKLVIAGNHDLLLDPAFVDRFPERILEKPGSCRSDLRWGNLVYLKDSSITLGFPDRNRFLRVYGSPWTPQFGTWAFQHPPIRDVWSGKIPDDTDVLLTHGPPKGHLDLDGAGSKYLMRELWRTRPQVVIFGHVHGGRGKETLQYNRVQAVYDDVISENKGLASVFVMVFSILMQKVMSLVLIPGQRADVKTTTLVNAAVVSSFKKDLVPSATTLHV